MDQGELKNLFQSQGVRENTLQNGNRESKEPTARFEDENYGKNFDTFDQRNSRELDQNGKLRQDDSEPLLLPKL